MDSLSSEQDHKKPRHETESTLVSASVASLAKLLECDLSDPSPLAMQQYLMKLFHEKGKVPRAFLMEVVDQTILQHAKVPNVVPVQRLKTAKTKYAGKLTVVGDVHGQFEDFAQIFENAALGGFPAADNQFIFNGDLVDRGDMSVEILIMVMVAKLQCDTSVYILRGNHEDADINLTCGFKKEVLLKYDLQVFNKCQELFQSLPIAAVIEDEVFVVHGGLGRTCWNKTIAQLNELKRVSILLPETTVYEMLWNGKHSFYEILVAQLFLLAICFNSQVFLCLNCLFFYSENCRPK